MEVERTFFHHYISLLFPLHMPCITHYTRALSSHAFFSWHAPSIFPLAVTSTVCGFKPFANHSSISTENVFLSARLWALALDFGCRVGI